MARAPIPQASNKDCQPFAPCILSPQSDNQKNLLHHDYVGNKANNVTEQGQGLRVENNTPFNEKQSHSTSAPSLSAAEYLNSRKTKVKTLWEEKVRDKVPDADEQTSLALLTSMDCFLEDLVSALAHSASPVSVPASRGRARSHGEQRAHFSGYLLPQLLKEFSILREVVLCELYDVELLTYDVGTIINNTIDQAMSSAAAEFVFVQQEPMKAALGNAEISNQELEQFAAVAAHDLKSPLATIAGYLDLLEEGSDCLQPEFLQYLKIIRKSSERMRNLIDRLLDYARLVKVDNSFCTVSLNDVAQSAVQNLHETIIKTRAQIQFGSLPEVVGDADLLIQLFQNLIANSLKFHSEQNPIIRIDAVSQGEHLLLSFQDNGVGFDPIYKDDIFVLYKKLQGGKEHQGVGIGLATCKKVVELHGGQIWADSTPGEGATFYFTLPNFKESKV